MGMEGGETKPMASARATYARVFLVLIVVTVIEVLLSVRSIFPRTILNSLFILLSLAKASFVAAYYMHLRQDARVYSYVFVFPVILFLIFAYLILLS